MTEETVVTSEVVETPEVTYTPLEQEVMEQGWLPKDKFVEAGHSEDEWTTAREFKKHGELMSRIEAQGKELRATRSSLNALKGHYERVKETEFKNALDTLKAQKKQALEDGDADAVIAVDEKIADVRDVQKAQAAAAPEVNPAFTEWVSANSWYSTNQEMQTFADSIGRSYAVSNPGIAPTEVLSYVSNKVKQAFPEKFKNQARQTASPVEGVRSVSRKVVETFELTSDEERAMNKFVSSGLMTKEKYIADLKKIRGVK